MEVVDLDRSLERSFKDLAIIVWRHKVTFVAASSTIFVMIVAGTLTIRPIYEASTLLISGQASAERLPDGSRSQVESAVSLARIAESQEVVEEAIRRVGLKGPQNFGRISSMFMNLRGFALQDPKEPALNFSATEAALPRVRGALSVRSEVTSDLITIAFRDPNPIVATNYANAIAQAFIDRHLELLGRSGAADFFKKQHQRFEDEIKRTSQEFEKFGASKSLYSIDDQRQLLLKRLSELSAETTAARSSIADKTGQLQSLGDTLRRLAPVARSPYVSSLVESLSGPPKAPVDTRTIEKMMENRATDPPMLLIKVYQDSMVELFKLNADLAGLRNRQKQQIDEMAKLTAELNALSQNEQQFLGLKRAMEQAVFNSEQYSKRIVDEQIATESRAAKFSSVKVVQKATMPQRPVFPNYNLIIGGGALLSAFLGVGAAYLRYRLHSNMKLRQLGRFRLQKQ